ncbi:MAG: class I SAM-dependent methyltransferase [Verrucomicrobiota bacterium]
MDNQSDAQAVVETAYSKEAAASYDEKRFGNRGGQEIHRIEAGVLEDALKKTAPEGRCLEVGCGTGRLLTEACALGYLVDGLDPSQPMLEETGEKLKTLSPESKLMVGEAASLPVADGAYDFVYSIRVLNQTPSEAYALDTVEEMIRAARPGGHILIEFMSRSRQLMDRKKVRLGEEHFKRVNRTNVRLLPREVIDRSRKAGAELVEQRGAFFLGMTSFYSVPAILLKPLSLLDRGLSSLMPGLCSRCYVLLRKNS